jgi:competence protein ComEC
VIGARIPARIGLAGVAIACAAGIAVCDRSGWLAELPLAWAAAAALALPLAWRARWRRAAALMCGFCAAAALAAAQRADLSAARARLGPWLDDREEETLSGRVAAPVEDDGQALRFALDLAPTGALARAHPARVLVSVFRDPGEPAWTPPILPGDEVELTSALRTPRGYRVPGAPPPDRAAAARGAAALASTDWTRVNVRTGGGLDPWRAAARMQRRSARRIGAVDDDGVLRALVTGDTSAMSERDTARYRDSGASHVLAVSGLHLAAVALFAFAGLRRLWASVPALALRVDPTRAAALFAAPAAAGYTMMTGAAPSAVRALWMVLFVLLGAALDRRARASDALGGAALLMLAARPASLFDPSLQLSFAATSALAVFMRGRARELGRARRVWGWLRDLVVASLWTWAATAPISAVPFGAVALAGPVANLVAVPAVELVALPLGLAGALLAELWPAGGAFLLAGAAALIARVSGALGRVAAWIPPWPLPPPDLLELAAWAALLAAAALARSPVRRRRGLAIGAAAAAILVGSWLWRSEIAPARRADLRVTFVDVGQGDAAVIELPGGGVWLIDAGGLPFSLPTSDADAARRLVESPGREAVARTLAHRRIRRIDLAILSHAHPDHYRGLGPVGRSVAIDELWLARPHEDAPVGGELAHLLAELAARGTRVRSPRAGEVVRSGGVALTVLAPGPADDGLAAADPVRSENDNSLVVRVDFAGRRLLFPGDLEEEGEEDLVREQGAGLAVDLVKVPHHGSRTSSTAGLVAATSPGWAIISCGRLNRFHFPHRSVVERWTAAGATVVRTDRAGTITAIIEPAGAMRLETVDDPTEVDGAHASGYESGDRGDR